MFLTREEIAELTGAKTKLRQIRVLVSNGIRHYLNAAGWAVVTRSSVEAVRDSKQEGPRWKPRKAA